MSAAHRAQVRGLVAEVIAQGERVHPDWPHRGYAFHRAIWTECAELMHQLGWSASGPAPAPDMAHARLEVGDILIFGMAQMLSCGANPDSLAGGALAPLLNVAPATDLEAARAATERLAQHALQTDTFSVDAFAGLMRSMGMSFDDVCRAALAKTALARLRSAQDYSSGGYRKVWAGREDCEHLAELVGSMGGAADAAFAERLYAALEERYGALVTNPPALEDAAGP